MPRSSKIHAGLDNSGQQSRAIAMVNLAKRQCVAWIDQLVAGGEDTNHWPAVHWHVGQPQRGEHCPARRDRAPDRRPAPAGPFEHRTLLAGCPAGRSSWPGWGDTHPAASSASSTLTTASAPDEIEAPVVMRTAVPGYSLVQVCDVTRRLFADHSPAGQSPSAAHRAKPSTTAAGKGNCSATACTSAASTRPSTRLPAAHS